MPKVRTRVKPRKLNYQVLKTRNQRQAQKLRNLYRRVPLKIPTPIPGVIDDGWSYDEWNDHWSSIGWHEGWDQTYDNSASSFSLGTFDLGAMSSPKRVEWVKMNLDAESMELWSKWSRRWNGRLTGAHKVLCNAGEIACKGRQDFYLGHDGGYMISIHSKIGQGMRMHFERLVNWYGRKQLIPVHIEDNIFNFLFEHRTEIHRDQNCEHFSAKSDENSEHGSGPNR